MDTFIEKIVQRKKEIFDYAIIGGIILAAFILLSFTFLIPSITIVIAAAIAYGSYYVISTRNIEYEYIVTNGDLDIDMIIARRKRKRIFSGNCKDFDIVAKMRSDNFSQQVQNIKHRIVAASSLAAENVYFLTLNYKGERTVVFFEPDERILNSFKTFIPRKVMNG